MQGVKNRLMREAGKRVRGMLGPVAELLFPSSCWVSETPISREACGLSETVREQMARGLLWPYCPRCGATAGRAMRYGPEHRCGECPRRELGVERIVRVGTYDEPLAALVRGLKFQRRWEIAKVVAPFLYQAMAMATEEGTRPPIDRLVPVALHWRRKWQRGFNQSEELARETGELGKWPVCNALRRVRATPEQSHLQSAAQRKENLRGAFECVRPEAVAGRHVWLIDDVSTTGATLHAAAMALHKLPRGQRPAGVYAAVLCVTDRVPAPEPTA